MTSWGHEWLIKDLCEFIEEKTVSEIWSDRRFKGKKINAEITTALKYINHLSTSMRRMYI